jgi:hypothetical protein
MVQVRVTSCRRPFQATFIHQLADIEASLDLQYDCLWLRYSLLVFSLQMLWDSQLPTMVTQPLETAKHGHMPCAVCNRNGFVIQSNSGRINAPVSKGVDIGIGAIVALQTVVKGVFCIRAMLPSKVPFCCSSIRGANALLIQGTDPWRTCVVLKLGSCIEHFAR